MDGSSGPVALLTVINTLQTYVPVMVLTMGGPGSSSTVPAVPVSERLQLRPVRLRVRGRRSDGRGPGGAGVAVHPRVPGWRRKRHERSSGPESGGPFRPDPARRCQPLPVLVPPDDVNSSQTTSSTTPTTRPPFRSIGPTTWRPGTKSADTS